MSSPLVQVTVSPTFTVTSGGLKVKLSILTLCSSARAGATPSCRMRAAARTRYEAGPRRAADFIADFPLTSALQRRVDDREPLVAELEVDAGDTEHAAQLGVLDLHRP